MLSRWQVTELTDDCCLIVSELVGNAIRHTTSDGAPSACRLILKLFEDSLAVEVQDPGCDTDVRPRRADVLSESGRGLAIVAALCGTSPLVLAEPQAGKTVVAILPRPAQL